MIEIPPIFNGAADFGFCPQLNVWNCRANHTQSNAPRVRWHDASFKTHELRTSTGAVMMYDLERC